MATYEIVCNEQSNGNEDGRRRPRWRTASPKNPDINVVYTINEPAAYGAYAGRRGQAGKPRTTC